jgi:hypothetical protein
VDLRFGEKKKRQWVTEWKKDRELGFEGDSVGFYVSEKVSSLYSEGRGTMPFLFLCLRKVKLMKWVIGSMSMGGWKCVRDARYSTSKMDYTKRRLCDKVITCSHPKVLYSTILNL